MHFLRHFLYHWFCKKSPKVVIKTLLVCILLRWKLHKQKPFFWKENLWSDNVLQNFTTALQCDLNGMKITSNTLIIFYNVQILQAKVVINVIFVSFRSHCRAALKFFFASPLPPSRLPVAFLWFKPSGILDLWAFVLIKVKNMGYWWNYEPFQIIQWSGII